MARHPACRAVSGVEVADTLQDLLAYPGTAVMQQNLTTLFLLRVSGPAHAVSG